MRRAAIGLAVAALQLWGCSGSGSGSSNGTTGGNTGPAKLTTDLTSLDFGFDTGDAVFVGTSLMNTVQLFNSGGGTITITGATVGTGATTFTQQLPATDGGLASSVLAADTAHPEYFAATMASQSTVSGSQVAAIQVTFTPLQGGLFSASLTITSSANTVTVGLIADAVTGAIATCDGKTSYTLPTVYLPRQPNPFPDGGHGFVSEADGGPSYETGFSKVNIALCDIGSSGLTLQPPSLSVSGDTFDWFLCQNPDFTNPPCYMYDATTCPVPCLTGPFPTELPAAYEDGGLALSFFTDGGSGHTEAFIIVDLKPSVPGTYTQTVSVPSTATNVDGGVLVLTVSGTAVPLPDGG